MQEVKSNKYVLSQAYIKILYINLQLEGKILSSMRRQSYDLGHRCSKVLLKYQHKRRLWKGCSFCERNTRIKSDFWFGERSRKLVFSQNLE